MWGARLRPPPLIEIDDQQTKESERKSAKRVEVLFQFWCHLTSW
jgi:hypothetical protein